MDAANHNHLCSAQTDARATKVPEGYRLAFLPRHFGRLFMQVESSIYGHMRDLCPGYTGGYWEFFDLINGGCYMAPAGDAFEIHAPNGHSGTVSGDAAGIIATLYALSHLAFRFEEATVLSDRFHQLREFALDHGEAAAILAAID